ncbi:MAG: hypothetical protein LBB72_07535 [Spirochaetaceae bacterium]|jgi:hypothetical protein|nr:hypothetical protein [Spirochaetaceae bacterium]
MKTFAIIVTTLLICSCVSAPPVKSFTVDFRAPRHEMGKTDAYFDKAFSFGGGVNKDDITVYYYPADDAVGMEFSVQFVECCLFWSKSGRDAFISALERYKDEFDQRVLVTKSKKTREAYGSVEGFLTWRRTKVSVQAHGSLKVYLGYQFKDNAAFFTMTQMESYYEDPLSRSRSQSSQTTMVYFTRAQAERLAALFSQEHINSLGFPGRTPGAAKPGMDNY